MKSLAQTIVAGNGKAIAALLGFAVLAFLLPIIPVGILGSGGTAVLLGLVHANQPRSLGPLGVATSVLLALGLVFMRSPWSALLFAGVFWWIPWMLARVFQKTGSLAFTLQIIGLGGILLLLIVRIVKPDIDLYWHELIKHYVDVLSKQTEVDSSNFSKLTEQVPYGLTAQLIASLMLFEAIILFIGRWLQSSIDTQVSLSQDFRTLKLGKFLGLIALVMAIIALVFSVLNINVRLAQELALVALSLFVLQGLAISHVFVGTILKSKAWLVLVYAGLIVVPFFSFAVTLAGVIDNFANFRKFIVNR